MFIMVSCTLVNSGSIGTGDVRIGQKLGTVTSRSICSYTVVNEYGDDPCRSWDM